MTNSSCKMGTRTKAARRRIAGMLISGTLAGTMAAGGAGMVHVAAATWQENADYIFEYLTRELGYTEAAACGIMANIRCESTFNPHAWNAGGGSYGLCQWTGGRYGRLRSWCGSNGFDYTTIDGQLAYLEYELQNHYPRVEEYLRSVENTQDGAYNAGQYYCYHFEAPASRGSVSVYRGGLASGTFWDSYRPAEWYQIDGIWHYILRDGSYQTEWLSIEDETFYFDEDGKRISGWQTIDGNRYFFDEDGVMVTGWKKIDGRSYYFDSDGSLVTGLVHNNDDWYLVDSSGNVQASADLEAFAPEWTAAEAERETALASAARDTESGENPDLTPDLTEEQPEELAAAEEKSAGLLTEDTENRDGETDAANLSAIAAADTEAGNGEEEAANLSAIAAAENEPEEREDSYLAAAEAMQSAAMQQDEEKESAGPSGEQLAALPSSVLEMAGPLPALSNGLFEGETPPVLPSSEESESSVAENEDTEQKDPVPEAEEQETAPASADSNPPAGGEEQETMLASADSDPAAGGMEQRENTSTGAPAFDLPSSVLEMAGPLPALSNDLFAGKKPPLLPSTEESETAVADNENKEQDAAPETEEETTALAFADPDRIPDENQKETGSFGDLFGGNKKETDHSQDIPDVTQKDVAEETDKEDKADKSGQTEKKGSEDKQEDIENPTSDLRENENGDMREETAKNTDSPAEVEDDEEPSEAEDADLRMEESEEIDSENGKEQSEDRKAENTEEESVEMDSENKEEESGEKDSENEEEESGEKDSENEEEESVEKDSENKEEESVEKDSENKEEESEEKEAESEEERSEDADSGDEEKASENREPEKDTDVDTGAEAEDSNRIVVEVENLEDDEDEESGTSEEGSVFFSDMEDARRKILGENEEDSANEKISLTLDEDRLPSLSEEDLENPDALVKELYAKEILRAVSGTGLDLTPEVTASVERAEEESDTYTITFSVEFGGESAEVSTEVTVETETQ